MPRGPQHQLPARKCERRIRRRALALARWGRRRGHSKGRTARALGLAVRTLLHWGRLCASRLRMRGRPLQRGTVEQRNRALATLARLGPHTGLPCLRALHPELARAELVHMQRRFRRAWRRRHSGWMNRLRWSAPGTVWAMDFTQPDAAIDGQSTRVLFVRDLASGCTLLARPCKSESSEVTVNALTGLFAVFGPPLVLKSDNGSAFASGEVQLLLAQNSVIPLFSPPYWPRYNGSCERGLGWLKVRARHLYELAAQPGTWSSSDLQRASTVGNLLSRPWGWDKPTPGQAWNARMPITREQRQALVKLREARLADFCAAEVGLNSSPAEALRAPRITNTGTIRPGAGGQKPPPPGPADDARILSKHERASLERKATASALVDLGFLCYRRKRFTPPVTPGKRAIK